MYMRAQNVFGWQVGRKSEKKGYICVAKCHRGFTWFNSVQKCLGKIDSTPTNSK